MWSLLGHTNHNKKKLLFLSYNIRMINLSLNELKLIAKSRNIKDYKNKSENDFKKIVSKSKPKINFLNVK